MGDQQQEPPIGLDQLQARHQNDSSDIDPLDVALLFNRVGSELTKIDKQSLGESQKRAMQLDQQAVFRDIKNTQQPQPVQPAPPAPHTQPVQPTVAAPKPIQPVAVAKQPVDVDMLKRLDIMEKKLNKIESVNKAYQRSKKIKHGTTYSVSSNSMKGEIKSADVLLEYIMCEISKGVKSITIKISE